MVHTCEICHMTYCTDIRSDVAMHRRRHAKFQSSLEPKPNHKFLAHLQQLPPSVGEIVTVKSPAWLHREVYRRARVFKIEFQYDFTQWGGGETYKNKDLKWQGHLFDVNSGNGPAGLIGGACAFYAKTPWLWSLSWVWIAPQYRRSGLLTQRWNSFLERYGDFILEHPFSPAMQRFLARHGTQQQSAHLQFYKGVGVTTMADILNAPDHLVQEVSGPQSIHSRAFRSLFLERGIEARQFERMVSAYVEKLRLEQAVAQVYSNTARASLYRTFSSPQMSRDDYDLVLEIINTPLLATGS